MQIRQLEDLDQAGRILGEKAVVRQGEATAIQDETVKLARAAAQAGQTEAAAARGKQIIDVRQNAEVPPELFYVPEQRRAPGQQPG